MGTRYVDECEYDGDHVGATRLVITTMIMGMLIPRLKNMANSLKREDNNVKRV